MSEAFFTLNNMRRDWMTLKFDFGVKMRYWKMRKSTERQRGGGREARPPSEIEDGLTFTAPLS